ncbi:acyl-[acyl-carrier-protein] thioesterase [Rhodococcus sp. NPDC127528]|uniref:acyl-[acyl-carrier-protein] thioesterase n=1 Tax=unclassified Rhodococcus (in: high G+C Gram-positive bacteria) TaxID=192944 RepID=UPI003624B4A7
MTDLAPVPESGHVFDTSWPMATPDMDDRCQLGLVGIARSVQEAGVRHLEYAGMMDVHPHWIMRRAVVDVLRPIEWPDRVRVRRWCSGISSRWCAMRVRFDGDNGGLVETEGFWINVSKQTMGPARLSDEFVSTMATTTDELRLRWKAWLTEHPTDGPGVDFPLRRTDIDHFNHVNNTAYWHGVVEVLAGEPDLTSGPYRAVIEYAKPIRYDEPVHIGTRRRGDVVDMSFAVLGDVRTFAQVRALLSPPERSWSGGPSHAGSAFSCRERNVGRQGGGRGSGAGSAFRLFVSRSERDGSTMGT